MRFELGVRDSRAVPIGQPVELTADGGELTRRDGARRRRQHARGQGPRRHLDVHRRPRARHRLRGPQQRRAQRRGDGHPSGALPHPGPHPRPADLPVRGAPRGGDRGRRDAGDRHLRRAGHRQGVLREAHDRHQHARPSRAPGTGSATTRRTTARKTYWQAGTDVSVDIDVNSRPRRQRHLRPGEPHGRLPGRRRARLQGQRADAPDAGLLQRRRSCGPSRSPPASRASPPARAPR